MYPKTPLIRFSLSGIYRPLGPEITTRSKLGPVSGSLSWIASVISGSIKKSGCNPNWKTDWSPFWIWSWHYQKLNHNEWKIFQSVLMSTLKISGLRRKLYEQGCLFDIVSVRTVVESILLISTKWVFWKRNPTLVRLWYVPQTNPYFEKMSKRQP